MSAYSFFPGGANVRPLFFREEQMSAPLFSGRANVLHLVLRRGKCSGGKRPTLVVAYRKLGSSYWKRCSLTNTIYVIHQDFDE